MRSLLSICILVLVTTSCYAYSELRDDDGYLVETSRTRDGLKEVRDPSGYLLRTERIQDGTRIYRDADGYLIGTKRYGK